MKIFKILAAMALLNTAFTASAQELHLNGEIKDAGNSRVIIMYYDGYVRKMDTVSITQDKFTWNKPMLEPQRIVMLFPRRGVDAYVESGTVEIKGHSDSLIKARITGSKLQLEAEAYDQLLNPITAQENPIYQKYGKVSKEEQYALEQQLQGIKQQKRALVEKYITQNPDHVFSAMLVSERAALGDYASISALYDKLGEKAKRSMEGKRLALRLNFLKRTAIGAQMYDFSQNDTNGKPVSFSAFKGKYVLVDFWASWCGPCRAENPNVLKAYNKYKDQNFTVVGISLDDSAENWKKAIQEDGMPWTQLSDLKGKKNAVAEYYGILGIPSTLLVGPDGKIIAKDLRREMLNKKLEEIFEKKSE